MTREVTDMMARVDGVRPEGWLSPYLTPSLQTPDYLVDNGYSYVLDWGTCDEQPFWMKGGSNGRNGRLLAMPYPIELNDQPAIVGRRHSAEQYADMLIDQFDEMKRRSRKAPLVFGMSLHTFIVGQPFRIVHLRRALEHMRANSEGVWWPLPRDIARYYQTLPASVQLSF